jgi:hypothetical protein
MLGGRVDWLGRRVGAEALGHSPSTPTSSRTPSLRPHLEAPCSVDLSWPSMLQASRSSMVQRLLPRSRSMACTFSSPGSIAVGCKQRGWVELGKPMMKCSLFPWLVLRVLMPESWLAWSRPCWWELFSSDALPPAFPTHAGPAASTAAVHRPGLQGRSGAHRGSPAPWRAARSCPRRGRAA